MLASYCTKVSKGRHKATRSKELCEPSCLLRASLCYKRNVNLSQTIPAFIFIRIDQLFDKGPALLTFSETFSLHGF